MKWIGLFLVLVGSAGAGFAVSGEYTGRIKTLKQVCMMLRYIQDLIVTEYIPLPEAFSRCGERMDAPFSDFLFKVAGQMDEFCGEDVEMLWKNSAPLVKPVMHKKDYEMFLHCMKQTGFMDASGQGQALRAYEQSVERQLTCLTEQKVEKCRLYQTLGIMSGIFMCILLL